MTELLWQAHKISIRSNNPTNVLPPLIFSDGSLNETYLNNIEQSLSSRTGRLINVGQAFKVVQIHHKLNDDLSVESCLRSEYRKSSGTDRHKTCASANFLQR